MARYNIRDLLGHWNARPAKPDQMCPHACCRNKRVHPANFPVILPRQLLRQATDQQLADHYGQHAHNGNARRQIVAEMERRDRSERRRKEAKLRRGQRVTDRQLAKEAQWLAAERATGGHMLNARGRRAGISERRLFNNARDRERYASPEFIRFMDEQERRGSSVGVTDRQRYRGAR